jgi:hypothetical protein
VPASLVFAAGSSGDGAAARADAGCTGCGSRSRRPVPPSTSGFAACLAVLGPSFRGASPLPPPPAKRADLEAAVPSGLPSSADGIESFTTLGAALRLPRGSSALLNADFGSSASKGADVGRCRGEPGRRAAPSTLGDVGRAGACGMPIVRPSRWNGEVRPVRSVFPRRAKQAVARA